MDKRKFLGTIVGAVFFIVCLLFVTYAWYSWRSSDTDVDITISDYRVEMTLTREINADKLGPVLDYLNSEYYEAENEGIFVSYADFSIDNPASYDYYMTAKLDITSISESLQVDSFKYSLVRESSTSAGVYDNVVCEGTFESFDVGENLACHNIVIPTGVVTNYRFVVYIDGTMYNNNDMMSSSLNSVLNVFAYKNYNLDTSGANEPYIGSNTDTTLIPVYYDQTSGNWKKADKSNANENYQWYNYDEKMWANAVLVSSTNRNVYKSAALGTTISMSDILAFYVWIPRYKYRVWNISRQAGDESTYAYPAYTEGIDIEFEINRKSTGNVECTYDTATVESEDNLSDVCVYNETDTITTSSVNSNYTDAWYTHPGFNLGTSSKSGFWVGKFETGGTASSPVIKPDVQSLRSQTVSAQFTTSKIFQTYGLSSRLEAHMMTNLEWGAVAYFTHSKYGLCNSGGCRDPYFNNSTNIYTGRSYGGFADVNSSSTSGTYSYDGYVMTDDTTKSATRDISKIASTTGNIYGIYDMNGGVHDYTMGNMVDSSNLFYPKDSGTSWNGSNVLDSKYYNAYSYGVSEYDNVAFNRARLGDATSECVSSYTELSAWKSNVSINGAYSMFVTNDLPWFYRGGSADFDTSSLFYFSRYYGVGTDRNGGRSTLT